MPGLCIKSLCFGAVSMIFDFFHSFWTFYSIAICISKSSRMLSWCSSKSAQQKQIVCDNGASHAADEPVPSRPGTPEETKSPFEHGDVGFNTSPKVSELFVNPCTPYHFRDRNSFSLRKGNVLYPQPLAVPDIFFGGKAAISRHLPGRTSVDIFLALHKGHEHGRVRRVAALDQAVNNEAGLSTRKKNLVPVDGLPVAFLDNVGMALEERNDLLARGDLFPVAHPAPSLVHNTGNKINRFFQLLHEHPGMDNLLRGRALESCKDSNCIKPVAADTSRKIKQVPVTLFSYRFFPAVQDLKHSFFHHPAMIAERIGRSRMESFPLNEQSGDNSNAILKQAGISRIVDVALYSRGIDAHRPAFVGSSFSRMGYYSLVDGFPGLFAQGFDVLLQ